MPIRSRSGCPQCKRRRRKCDETRPGCLACQKRDMHCGGYGVNLQWGVGIASRGRFVGATIPVQTAEKSPSTCSARKALGSGIYSSRRDSCTTDRSAGSTCSPVEYNSPNGTSFEPSHEQQDVDATVSFSLASCTESSQGRRPHIRRSVEDWYLFDQAMDKTVYLLYSTRKVEWVVPLIRDLAQTSDALFIVLEALHLFCKYRQNLSVRFHEEVDRALRAFRCELDSSRGTMDGGTMCAGLFLCTLNILLGNPWTSHLKCMADLYQLHGDLSHLTINGPLPLAIQHPTEIMAAMDIPTLVLGRDIPTMGLWQRLRRAQDGLQGGQPGGVEVLTGIPRTLLDIFALFGHEDGEERDVEGMFWVWAGEAGELPQRQLWEAWRLAGVLTARRLQRRRKKRRSAASDGSSMGRQPPDGASLVGRLVGCIDALWALRDRPEYGHLLVWNALVYPFVAARLEVGLLREHPEWLAALDAVAATHFKMGPASVTIMSPTVPAVLKMLDEAVEGGDDEYDLDAAARLRGIEVALF